MHTLISPIPNLYMLFQAAVLNSALIVLYLYLEIKHTHDDIGKVKICIPDYIRCIKSVDLHKCMLIVFFSANFHG